jgi:hypothetical protein
VFESYQAIKGGPKREHVNQSCRIQAVFAKHKVTQCPNAEKGYGVFYSANQDPSFSFEEFQIKILPVVMLKFANSERDGGGICI